MDYIFALLLCQIAVGIGLFLVGDVGVRRD
jgi:hypothetical protein